ncbi:MAG: hypothetical protein IT500_16710 [Rubrivivax sp.]|nr:hypothetical protein [Rubrivivax sp.]
MTPDSQDVVRDHLLATARVLNRALAELRAQVGAEAHAAVVAALRGGGMVRATTTISLAGAMMVSFDLVGPRGDVVNLGGVEFDGPAPTVN